MSFILETTDMDLGDTPIENIFINDYMPMANGTYVKVYLLGFKYAHDKDDKLEVTNNSIAKHLDIPLDDVLRAWDFWEEKGIIEKHGSDRVNYKVKFLNLKQLYIKNNINMFNQKEEPKKEVKYSTQDLIEANQMPIINNMFNQIDYIMRRQTTPSEKKLILEWIHDYNMNPDVIEKAFFYAVEQKGIRKINYVEGIIRNWYDEGLTNIDAVIEHFRKSDEKYYRYQKVMKSLGLNNRPTKKDEKQLIDKWFDEYNFTMDIVLMGCETDKNVKPSVSYVNGTLKAWFEKGVKTVGDIELLDKPTEIKKPVINIKSKRPLANKTRFHNFEQRTEMYTSEELEAIAKRKREAHNQKLKGEA
ncbi:DnaD domain protein [Tissierella sp. Yu-01]|uniref:DnaD domain-containing protein n=1 Tax=Tissierella sp. Yu-01 TaxID=3035694 RepID=UPI00240CF858|nr:DnaD domain protein [Tissierella sp. Yu-01]WFA08365.1 DnaD domain protein [Tissierella sp. Yu-01]